METCDVLIIGAGATGMIAARILAKAGKKVIVLEARDRCGGRIHTINGIELGAEFIHGDLPVTLNLLKEAGIEYHHSGGEMWHYKDGKFDNEGGLMDDWGLLMQKLRKVKTDISISEFLNREFSGDQYEELKNSVLKFAAGYDTADPDKASTFALRDEWFGEDDEAQHRVIGGYGVMVHYLEEQIRDNGGNICLNSTVKKIEWQPGKVKAFTADGNVFEAEKLMLALPLGTLKADESEEAAITFVPPLSGQMEAINKMGFGAIIKILLEFDQPFWEDEEIAALAGKRLKSMAFLLSDEEIPTWWTQAPQRSSILTGWLGGPPALEKKDLPDTEILSLALRSLSNIFKRPVDELKNSLISSHVVNWTNDPFTLGSYAYDTVDAASSRKVLNEPVDDTIFFAGEYLYNGPAMGTVEAALTSSSEAAKKIMGGV